MENGRCRLHGGLTPKGDDWHRIRWPDPKSPRAEQRLQRKLRDHERDERERRARVAAMTPEERARYERWRRTHKPGSAARRAKARAERQQTEDARQTIASAAVRPAPPRSPAMVAVAERIAELQAELARMDADQDNGGVLD
jgi:hypothetical protein